MVINLKIKFPSSLFCFDSHFSFFLLKQTLVGCKFSRSSSRSLHFYNSGEEAVKEIPHGAKLLVGGQLNFMVFHIVSITQWLIIGKTAT